MKIAGREYVLSPRRASDVLDLAAAAAEYDDEAQVGQQMLIGAQIVSDSLRATGLKLGIRGWRYRRFIKRNGVAFLIGSLSEAELWSAYHEVLALEGQEKKSLMKEAAGESGGKSAAV